MNTMHWLARTRRQGCLLARLAVTLPLGVAGVGAALLVPGTGAGRGHRRCHYHIHLHRR